MTKPQQKFIEQWLKKANNDELAAKILIKHRPLILDTACFHCQQAIEKYFKAYLVYSNFNFPKTHELSVLKKACVSFDNAFAEIDIKDLDDFAVQVRYPDASIDPSLETSKEYIKIVNQTRRLVLKKIKFPKK
jgi:HEPN domain-containing protein